MVVKNGRSRRRSSRVNTIAVGSGYYDGIGVPRPRGLHRVIRLANSLQRIACCLLIVH